MGFRAPEGKMKGGKAGRESFSHLSPV